jgi:hypothetical protein
VHSKQLAQFPPLQNLAAHGTLLIMQVQAIEK